MIASTKQNSVGRSIPVANTCSGDGSFTITADAAPVLGGCFKDTGVTSESLVETYTVSGTLTQSQVVAIALNIDEDTVSRDSLNIVPREHLQWYSHSCWYQGVSPFSRRRWRLRGAVVVIHMIYTWRLAGDMLSLSPNCSRYPRCFASFPAPTPPTNPPILQNLFLAVQLGDWVHGIWRRHRGHASLLCFRRVGDRRQHGECVLVV